MTSGDGPTKTIPASSTILAKCAFSLKKPYLFKEDRGTVKALSGSNTVKILRGQNLPGMNHINAMFESNTDNIFLSEIRCYGSFASSDLIRFIGLSGEFAIDDCDQF